MGVVQIIRAGSGAPIRRWTPQAPRAKVGAMDDEHGPDPRRTVLDLRGLKCPLPVLHTRKALRRLPNGASLEVLCTDPLAGIDVPNLVRETGDALLAADRGESGWRFVIRRA